MPRAMSTSNKCRLLVLILLTIWSAGNDTHAQDPGEVIRVYTDVVQTDVMVFDKSGRFVENIRKEDFDLKIDGKSRAIDFLELVRAGKLNEDSQLSAARGSRSNRSSPLGAVPLDRGGTIFFYVDDLHLDLAGLAAAQKVITHFIDKEMGQNDEVAIASPSGQIGFLQQLTDNKSVLRSALTRLKYRPYTVRDFQLPRMTEYHALLIERYDHDLTGYFIEETMRANPGMTREMAENYVRSRSRTLLQQAAQVTSGTLAGLEQVVRTAAALPGRKLVFLISGGFFLDESNDSINRLRRVTSAAARSGVVIYSMDARGLVASLSDASEGGSFDPTGRLERANHSELRASQDSLYALAADTGGKAIFNTNALEPGLNRALEETAVYYLLGWKPDREGTNPRRFRRIEVSIPSRPELTVRVRRGFFEEEPAPLTVTKAKSQKPQENPIAKLHQALTEIYPVTELPVDLRVNYVDTPDQGLMISVSLQVAGDFLSSTPGANPLTGVVDIAGNVHNDKGQVGARFSDRITIRGPASATSLSDFAYTHNVFLKPGLYQIRVSAQDRNSGRVGSANTWIEVPDLSSGDLTLSSLLVGEQVKRPTTIPAGEDSNPEIRMSVDHRFRRGLDLSFVVFIYNAARSGSESDVALQVQLIRDDQPVMTTALKKLSTENVKDLKRIPYAALVPLDQPVGRYLLRVTAIDRISKTSAIRDTRFEIIDPR